MILRSIASVAAALLVIALPASAQRHTLFNPVPKDSMRDLNPDRPDRTEGPFTIDAGHYQLETEVFSRVDDRRHLQGITHNLGGFNFKAGILQNFDLELITQAVSSTSFDLPMYIGENSSFPDVTVRGKVNFWGNDGGPTAFGLIALVTVPANTPRLSNETTTGGVILPFNLTLGSYNVAVMSDLEVDRRDTDSKRVLNTIHSISVSKSFSTKLGGYVEFAGETVNDGTTEFLPTFDAGVMWTIGRNLQLDAGANFGLGGRGPTYTDFLGFTARH